MADHHNDNLFQVSVKGLYFDRDGRVLIMKDEHGLWDFPGGRMQRGEELIESLKRECKEETGLVCRVLGEQPDIVYAAKDKEGRYRIMVFYRIDLNSLNFTPSEECVEIRFCAKEEIARLDLYPQLIKLIDFLK